MVGKTIQKIIHEIRTCSINCMGPHHQRINTQPKHSKKHSKIQKFASIVKNNWKEWQTFPKEAFLSYESRRGEKVFLHNNQWVITKGKENLSEKQLVMCGSKETTGKKKHNNLKIPKNDY